MTFGIRDNADAVFVKSDADIFYAFPSLVDDVSLDFGLCPTRRCGDSEKDSDDKRLHLVNIVSLFVWHRGDK